MLKCKGCRRFTWGSFCLTEGEERVACPSNGDETKCELYPERRKIAQKRAEAELSRRIPAKWFDFEKQKPVHGDSVLGLDFEGTLEVYQYDEEWPNCLIKFDGNLKAFGITHWTLLPRPPKGE